MSATDGSSLKLCRNCKHLIYIWDDCRRVPTKRSKVDGRMKYSSARLERDYWNIVWWKCSKKGRFWESIK